MASNTVQTTFDRLVQLPGVTGAILIDGGGVPVRTNLPADVTQIYADRMRPLVILARSMVHDLENGDELTYVRLRTRRQETMVATGHEHTIILIQDNRVLDESRRNSVASRRSSAL